MLDGDTESYQVSSVIQDNILFCQKMGSIKLSMLFLVGI